MIAKHIMISITASHDQIT